MARLLHRISKTTWPTAMEVRAPERPLWWMRSLSAHMGEVRDVFETSSGGNSPLPGLRRGGDRRTTTSMARRTMKRCAQHSASSCFDLVDSSMSRLQMERRSSAARKRWSWLVQGCTSSLQRCSNGRLPILGESSSLRLVNIEKYLVFGVREEAIAHQSLGKTKSALRRGCSFD